MSPPTEFDDFGLGAIPSPPDDRDFLLAVDQAVLLPSRYVAPLMPPVLNQHATPMCVGFSTAGVKGFEERRDGHGFLGFDPAWLYKLAQGFDGLPNPHDGTTLRAALRVMKGTGYALLGHPETAGSFRIAAYYAVPRDTASIKRAVIQYGPVLIGSTWYGSWFHPVKGIMPAPSGGIVGGHARYIFGWDDAVNGGSFLVRNSWGSKWGVNGNSYDAYRQLVPALHDAWRATDVLGD